VLIARDAGITIARHPDARSAVAEIHHLQAAIGTTGLLALHPIEVTSRRDDWHRYVLMGSESTPSRVTRFWRWIRKS
jgi:hypothetical protein